MATVGKDASHAKSTGKFVKQGHTTGPYGNNPSTASINRNPGELKP